MVLVLPSGAGREGEVRDTRQYRVQEGVFRGDFGFGLCFRSMFNVSFRKGAPSGPGARSPTPGAGPCTWAASDPRQRKRNYAKKKDAFHRSGVGEQAGGFCIGLHKLFLRILFSTN